MSLKDRIRSGFILEPLKIVIYGEEKVGKSSFCSGAPNPLFLDVEGSTSWLSVERIHRSELSTYDDIIATVDQLINEEHDFQTIVIDSIDWVQERICEKVAKDYKAKAYNDNTVKALAYGAGTTMVFTIMKNFISKLDELRTKRRVNIIMVAHCQIKNIDEPTGATYHKYTLKLIDKIEGYCKEWADFILFAKKPINTYEDSSGNTKVADNPPILFTAKNGGFSGGGRIALPQELPLLWSAFSDAMKTDIAAKRAANKKQSEVQLPPAHIAATNSAVEQSISIAD